MLEPIVAELVEYGLMQQQEDIVWLTSRGRLLSNEIFQRFILAEEVVTLIAALYSAKFESPPNHTVGWAASFQF